MKLISKKDYFTDEYRHNDVPVFVEINKEVKTGHLLDGVVYKFMPPEFGYYVKSNIVLCSIDEVDRISGYTSFDF